MEAYIFDLDGTLLDTMGDIAAACNAILAAHGHPSHPASAYARMVGNGIPTLMRRAWPAAALDKLTDEEFDRIVTETRSYYAQHLWDNSRPYAGMTETLEHLTERGYGLAVLSNKPEELTKPLIAHFFPHIPFAAVQGGSAVRPLKPDPASASEVLTCLSLAPRQCFYVGDSDVDMITALRTGMRGVGAAWGFRGPDELRAAGAHHIVDKPADLLFLHDRSKETREMET